MARKRYKPEKIGNMLREAVNRLGRLTPQWSGPLRPDSFRRPI